MAQVTVGFDDYQAGRLPDVCVFTGAETRERMVVRTPIGPEAVGTRQAGRLLGSLDRLVVALDARRPEQILVGRLPVDADVLRRRRLALRVSRMVGVAAALTLVYSAWAAAVWSPAAAVASIAVLIAALMRRASLRRRAPRPTLIGAGTRVHLDNVHQRFVTAVESARP